MEVLNIYSFNTNGLGSVNKRVKALKFIKNKNRRGIFFLQETHSSEENRQCWENEMEGVSNVFFNHGESNARGAAILFNNVEFTVNSYYSDDDGRLQLLSINLDDFSKKFYLSIFMLLT